MAYTKDEVKWVFDRTGGRCFYCGMTLVFENYGLLPERSAWEVNYFIPKLDNGERRRENWVPACISCDTVKGECFPWEFDSRRFLPEDENPDNYIKKAHRSLPPEKG
jgi:5-methylcytosine-specific restriction endonuclease McrA